MKKYEMIMSLSTTAYASVLGGVECKSIVDTPDGMKMLCVSGAWCSVRTVHAVRINERADGSSYIRLSGLRIGLDEFIRV